MFEFDLHDLHDLHDLCHYDSLGGVTVGVTWPN